MSGGSAAPRVRSLWRGTSALLGSTRERRPAAGAKAKTAERPPPVLGSAAEAIVASLIDGTPLDQSPRAMRDLQDALMAESADAGGEAAARCAALRTGLALALRAALKKRPEAAALLEGDAPRSVRMEVRGTAGRQVLSEAFLVGRAAACDVQASGDGTVSRLQFIVVSLPRAVVVIDAWSMGGTRTVSRSASGATTRPSSFPKRRLAFVLGHRERVVLAVGKQTELTIGPPADVAAGEAATALPPAIQQTTPTSMQTTVPEVLTPTINMNASWAVAPTIPDAQPPSSGASAAGPPSVAVASCASSGARAAAAPSASSAAAASAPPAVRAKSREARKRSLGGGRASARTRRTPAARAETQWRCRAAVQSELLDDEQCRELEQRLNVSADSIQEVREILDGLGVPEAPPGEDLKSSGGLQLGPGVLVLIHGLGATPELNGSRGVCHEWLAERSRWAVRPCRGGELIALKPENLTALSKAAAPASEDLGAKSVACPTPGCGQTLVLSRDAPRRCYECPCGEAASRCTACGEAPYHFHGQCAEVPKLRQRWLDWLRGRGRRAYRALRKKAVREATVQRRALREAAAATQSSAAAADGAPATRRQHWLAARANFLRGEGVRHFFTSCALCGSRGGCIVGPRFQCLHCRAFDCCLKCEPRLQAQHPEDHVFAIHFECEFDWQQAGIQLPTGTRARLRQHPIDWQDAAEGAAAGEAAASSAAPAAAAREPRKRRGYGLEGVIVGYKRGRYDLQLNDDGSMRHVLPKDLQPLLTQKRAQQLLFPDSCKP